MTTNVSNWQKVFLIAGVASSLVLLSGCSFSAGAGTTGHRVNDDVVATKASFEKLVATSLAKMVDNGVTPSIDCGSDDIKLVNGRVQNCELSTADSPGTVYDVEVTISDVKNYDDYHIAVQVADSPQ